MIYVSQKQEPSIKVFCPRCQAYKSCGCNGWECGHICSCGLTFDIFRKYYYLNLHDIDNKIVYHISWDTLQNYKNIVIVMSGYNTKYEFSGFFNFKYDITLEKLKTYLLYL